MNSSGIKRGLAGSAVAALAVTGLPFLATSASAAPGDNFTVVYTGPALNGGDQGAVVVLRAEDGEIDETLLDLTSTSSALAGSEDTDTQSADIVGVAVADDPTNSNFDLIQVNIAVTTPEAGQTATFRVFEDDAANDGDLDAGEARQTVSVTTSGPLAQVEVAPASQSAPQGQTSGAYTVTLKDSAGRTTQLEAGETVSVTGDADVTPSDLSLDSDELERGTATFTAAVAGGAALGAHTITLNPSAPAAAPNATATLNVTKAANITADEVDIVTGADSWKGFGGGTDAGTTAVRVDQSSIRIDFDGDASDAKTTVNLTVTGTGVTFGGKPSTTVTTVLDSDGKGSVTITPDAGTVQENDSISVSGNGFDQTFDFERAEVTSIQPSADVFFSALKGSVDVTATVLDQFGLPVSSGFVEAERTGVNADTTPQRKAVGADGKVTFTFTDSKATNGQTETVDLAYFPDQFAAAPTQTGSATIKYTTDGLGSNFKTLLNGDDTEAADYKASDVTVVPLADAVDDGGSDSADLQITNGEAGAEITISVDNGALILPAGEFDLSDGKSSITDTVSGGGTLSGYKVVGTKAGIVTATITSAGRTETAQLTVAAQNDPSTARNVTVSGPATVEHGTSQITFTAVVTDAFGNPVAGLPREVLGSPLLNVTVSGPGQFQDGDVQTNANGEIKLNVKLDAGAEGPVTLTVQGMPGVFVFGGTVTQFGAAARTSPPRPPRSRTRRSWSRSRSTPSSWSSLPLRTRRRTRSRATRSTRLPVPPPPCGALARRSTPSR